MHLSTFAMAPTNHALAWMWRRRRLIATASIVTEYGIRYEAWARRLGLPAELDHGPHVHWHDGGVATDEPPVVLLNGFTGSGLAWPTVWVRELEASRRVIRIDNRGTGWSRHAPAPFTIADMADDVRDVLVRLAVPEAVVFGLSMGGMIAQELAVRHPALVSRLVLAATIPPLPHAVASPFGLSLAGSLLSAHGVDRAEPSLSEAAAAAAMWLRFAAEDFQAPPELVVEMGEQALTRATPWLGSIMQARAIQSWHGARRLATITAPTVVVHGRADRVIVPENGAKLARYIPGARLVELTGVGHLIPWEAGSELVRLLVD